MAAAAGVLALIQPARADLQLCSRMSYVVEAAIILIVLLADAGSRRAAATADRRAAT